MHYGIKKLPKSEVEIQVTIPFPDFEPRVKQAAVLISEETEIEGFRKGRASYDIVKQKVGEFAIYERAADLAVRKTYPEVMERLLASGELSIEYPPIGKPEITITKLSPANDLEYKVKLSILPEVKLPDYKEIAGRIKEEKKGVSVSDEEVDKTLKWVRESRAEGEGETKKVPELTDEFAKSLGDFPTVEALKSSVRDGLKLEKEERERQRIRMRIIEDVARDSGTEVPDVLVESELEKMLAELKSGVEGMGMKREDYLLHIKKSVEDLRKEWRGDAEKRVRIALCLREIAKKEKIEPTEKDVEVRTNEFLRQYKSAGEAEKNVDPAELKEYTKGILRNEKVFEFLEKI